MFLSPKPLCCKERNLSEAELVCIIHFHLHQYLLLQAGSCSLSCRAMKSRPIMPPTGARVYCCHGLISRRVLGSWSHLHSDTGASKSTCTACAGLGTSQVTVQMACVHYKQFVPGETKPIQVTKQKLKIKKSLPPQYSVIWRPGESISSNQIHFFN